MSSRTPFQKKKFSPCPCGCGADRARCKTRFGQRNGMEGLISAAERDYHWREKFGYVKQIEHGKAGEVLAVRVGNRVVTGNFKTFHDFLLEYVKYVFGVDWMKSEWEICYAQRHPIMQWCEQLVDFQRSVTTKTNGLYVAAPTGGAMAYLSLAYDLYLIENNSALQSVLVERLRNPSKFQGARFELMAAACCAIAGCDLEYEDETDGTRTHVEFTATHRVSKDRFAVEAKSKHRQNVLGFDDPSSVPSDLTRPNITGLLNNARQKQTEHPLVIFIDLNLPVTVDQTNSLPWVKNLSKTCESVLKSFGDKPTPFNMIVFSNRSFHYRPADHTLSDPAGFLMAPNPSRQLPYAFLTLGLLKEAVEKYGAVPMEFPPELI